MQVEIVNQALEDVEAEVLVLTVFEDELNDIDYIQNVDKKIGGHISRIIESGEIKGKFREFTLLHTDGIGAKRVLIMGLGKRKDFSLDRIRSIAANSSRYSRRINVNEMAMVDFAHMDVSARDCGMAITEGVVLGLYRFDKYKSKKKDKHKKLSALKIVASDASRAKELEEGAKTGNNLGESTNFARDLVNEPACYMTPTDFAKRAQDVAETHNIQIEILERSDLEDQGMGSFLAVAQGSDEPPKMVVMKYEGNPGGKTIGIVGKGVTFDSGGYDLKPSQAMLRMYADMGGAAATLGTIQAVAAEKLKVNLVAIMGLTENLVNGKAFKPSDILKSMSGKTIEVLNTDAEGRLVLCDAMTYMQKYHNPDVMVDVATLTGAAVVALGRTVSATLTNNDDLYSRMFSAGEYTGERVWRLPLYDEYRAQLVSDVADIESVGGRSAGTITAAMFLKEFVDEDRPWIHLDIAGTAMMEEEIARYVKNPYLPKEGGTGTGTRLMYHFVEGFVDN